MHKELITIIVLCYNHEAYLEQSIEAVYAQTYPSIQLIVTDDFSKDGSALLIQKLSNKRNFETVINTFNCGLNATLAKALDLAKGDYIAIISADDFMLPQKTALQHDYIKAHNIEGVYSNGFSIENDSRKLIQLNPVFKSNNKQAILNYIYMYDWGAPLLQSGLFHKKIWEQTMPLRTQFKSDDWAFLINAYQQFEISFLDEPLFCYRLHNDNTFKKYWFTFPMRIDVISRLVPEPFRIRATANILLSQGQYVMHAQSFFKGFRMQFAALMINFSWGNFISMAKSVAWFVRKKLH